MTVARIVVLDGLALFRDTGLIKESPLPATVVVHHDTEQLKGLHEVY